MARYIYSVQDEAGREATAWVGDVNKVTDISASVVWSNGEAYVSIFLGKEVVSNTHTPTIAENAPLTLHRWKAADKLGKPVSRSIAWKK